MGYVVQLRIPIICRNFASVMRDTTSIVFTDLIAYKIGICQYWQTRQEYRFGSMATNLSARSLNLWIKTNMIVLNPCMASRHIWVLLPWRLYQMETFSALLTISVGNSPVTGEFPAQRPVTRSFDVFFHLYLNKRLSKHSWGWWFGTPSRPLWRHIMN